jgi:iron complex outermembrane receptor protein
VVTTSDAGNGVGYTGIRIRGSDATRVNVTINGIPLNDAESHQVYWVDLPDLAASVESIQLQRGVGTSTNGPGAFGGSMNIQTTTRSQEPFAEISSNAGSFSTLRNSIRFGTGMLKDHFVLEGRLSRISSDGYIDRATSDLQSLYLSGGYHSEKQSLRVVCMSGREKTYQAWYGVPEDSLQTNRTYNMAGLYIDRTGAIQYYDNQTDNYIQNHYQMLWSRDLDAGWSANAALFLTTGKGYYEEFIDEDYYATGNMDPVDSMYIRPYHIRQRWLDNSFYGTTWSVQHRGKKLDLNAGGAVSRYEGDHFTDIIWQNYNVLVNGPYTERSDNASKFDGNIYLKADYSLTPEWNVTGDLQYRHVGYTFTGLDADGEPLPSEVSLDFFNPKAGITWEPNNWHRWYASVSVGQKEPVRDDYVASTASSRPAPERLVDYEAGYRYSGHTFTCNANFYYMDYARQLILNGSINDVGEFVRESVGDSYRSGIELEAAWAPSPRWTVRMNATVSRNRIANYTEYAYDSATTIVIDYPNTPIAYSPDLVAAGSAEWKAFKSLTISLTGKQVGEQYLDNTGNPEHRLEGYLVSDLGFQWSPTVRKVKKLVFRATIYNITDRMYSANGYVYYGMNYLFPQAGRHFMAGVTVGF